MNDTDDPRPPTLAELADRDRQHELAQTGQCTYCSCHRAERQPPALHLIQCIYRRLWL